ncbi:MAG: alanine--tRNA ligase, partial [Verrucomicrobiae bacterium]|nr:alanine--tRNA ligase [Verrucomicrobiae bacterium]MDW7979758.1 alanine--tRNA ligase [Verrucomicrobiales bacterium]
MTATEIRQSFLDFFKSKGHSIVPSSSLLPDSPNLLFTNAGMNQFVPIFLGQRKPDVSKWPGAIPGSDTRAANTQKCIRAGGKHNDLEDVGLDTYHHTFFEMLGNWSFGDYFKREAIQWAWELVVEKWQFPPERLYATVYKPGPGEPSEFDQEAYDVWAEIFKRAGLDPTVHIRFGGLKDNFWMMGDTGPCGPCSEIHVDLTPRGDSQGKLVNAGSSQCIEVWNLVFIQFNANPDGTLSPLPARHVDTGMGLERVAAIVQGTNGLKDFANARISNYETDLFRPLLAALERLSGKRYAGTVPARQTELSDRSSQVAIDVAFRVIADHIRTLGFAIADGILPSNEGRGYVLRRILRRAVRYGRTLGFHEPFFFKLVDVLAETMGDVFPEIRARKTHVQDVIRREEEAFNRTLDRGIALFEEEVARLLGGTGHLPAAAGNLPAAPGAKYSRRNLPHFERPWAKYMVTFSTVQGRQLSPRARDIVLESILWTHRQGRWQLFAACVMPDHVHVLFEPQIKEQDATGKPVFWSVTELLHSVKSFTAHEINKLEGTTGAVWEKESFDRLIRSDADLEEKFHYICRNPWDNNVVPPTEPYRWLWTPDAERGAHASGVPAAASTPTCVGSQTLPAQQADEPAQR